MFSQVYYKSVANNIVGNLAKPWVICWDFVTNIIKRDRTVEHLLKPVREDRYSCSENRDAGKVYKEVKRIRVSVQRG
jgi:hypothetical protein